MTEAIADVVEGAVAQSAQSVVIDEGSHIPAAKVEPSFWDDAELGDGFELADKDKEFKTLADYVKHTHSLRGMIDAKGIIPPAEGEDKTAFLEAIKPYVGDDGPAIVPDTYAVEAIDASEGMTDDRKTGIYGDFKELKLTQAQADGVMSLYGKQLGMDGEEVATAAVAERAASLDAMKGDWGDKSADHIAGIERVETQHADAMEAITAAGLQGNPAILAMLDAVASGTVEDQIDDGAAGGLDVQDQINAIKANPLYKNGSVADPARVKLMSDINALYGKL